MQDGWFRAARAARYPTAGEAARACGVSPALIDWLEAGSVTAPELARQLGRVLGLTDGQIHAITSQETVARRELERHYGPDDKIVMARY
jgi:transcriptional regulator with XRE-family HTH domain